MAKLSVSVDVPLPPETAWACASDLSRYKEWLTIHRVWRSKLPETLEKGTVLDSIVEVFASVVVIWYIADHATSIAEAVVYLKEGDIVRHALGIEGEA